MTVRQVGVVRQTTILIDAIKSLHQEISQALRKDRKTWFLESANELEAATVFDNL